MEQNSALTTRSLLRILRGGDALFALAVVGIIAIMVIPLPTMVLDLLITLNITFAVTIMLVAMYITEPLQFSVFPSLLLIATLFRLSLNISATRLILLQGFAGNVIESFGNFVVGGNYVVGIVVFMILMIIQFVVITNGAGRVAEVAARFTLDAMPGKQMSIDADLNAGFINETQARARRRTIEREADFYGAMDGASKFVRGDAIAALVILAVNIVGGIIIGVVQQGMPIQQALSSFTLLTIGDGLVSQIPALLISTATGLIVTRAASETNLGTDVIRQVLARPRATGISSILLLGLGILPGLPNLPFLLMGGLVATISFTTSRRQHAAAAAAAATDTQSKETEKKAEDIPSLLHIPQMEVEIGYGLIGMVDGPQGGLLDRISMIRRQIALELGMVLPSVRVRDNLDLGPNTYVIKIKGAHVTGADVNPNGFLAMDPGTVVGQLEGIPTTEPAFGLPALWITAAQRGQAEMMGYTVVDPVSVVATHLTETIKRHADALLGRQETQNLLNTVKQETPAVVDELVPALLTLGEVQRVLQNLLRERVSIRDLVSILEALANYARLTRDSDVLTDYTRQAIAHALATQYCEHDRVLHVMTLAPQVEAALAGALQATDEGTAIIVPPPQAARLLEALAKEMEAMATLGYSPIILCAPRIRLPLRRLTERNLPNLVLLSYREIPATIEVRTHGVVMLREN